MVSVAQLNIDATVPALGAAAIDSTTERVEHGHDDSKLVDEFDNRRNRALVDDFEHARRHPNIDTAATIVDRNDR